jgi:TorA maturation chaperone TorD
MSETDALLPAGRAALLDLLADLLLREVDAQMAALLGGDPALNEALCPPQSEQSLRELRATYAQLFLIELPPYASLYLEAPPVVGGESSLHWERFLAAQGQPLASLERAAATDHAGLFLRALAAAERTGNTAAMISEALRWLPQFFTAVQRSEGERFYGRAAALATLAVQESARIVPYAGQPLPIEGPPAPADDSLREMARWLCTPAWSGWFLSKSRLRQLAAAFGVALGIVEREQMLEQVFEASALDGRTGELLDALLAEHQHWTAALQEWQQALGAWKHPLEGWETTLQRTQALLNEMRLALTSWQPPQQ